MPTLMLACRRIQMERDVQFVLALAPGVQRSQVAQYLLPEVVVEVVKDASYDALGAADISIVSSGTATVEAALMDAPMIVVYRLAPLTAAIAQVAGAHAHVCHGEFDRRQEGCPRTRPEGFHSARLAEEAIRLLDIRGPARKCAAAWPRCAKNLGRPEPWSARRI